MTWIVVGLAAVVSLGLLTGLGSRRRNPSLLLAIASAILFPLAWAVWYVQDEHPYAR